MGEIKGKKGEIGEGEEEERENVKDNNNNNNIFWSVLSPVN